MQVRLFFLLSLAVFTQAYAQNEDNFVLTIDSKVYGEEREIRIFLPEDYFADSTSRFTVTYVLDAQSDGFWDMARGNIAYLTNNYCIMPTMAVGVVSQDRGGEFSPDNPKLREHLREEVFPLVEERFRTLPFRSVIGHSWGGAFVGSTLFGEHRDMFTGYIGVSPSLDAMDYWIVEQADSMFKAGTTINKYFYSSVGDLGTIEYENGIAVEMMDSVIKLHQPKDLIWKKDLMPDRGHWSLVVPSFNNALLDMSRNFSPDLKVIRDMVNHGEGSLGTQLKAFTESREAKYGFAYHPSPYFLLDVGDNFRDNGENEKAIEIYDLVLESIPRNITTNLNRSQCFEELGKKDTAQKGYQHTRNLLEERKAEVPERFYNNVSKWLDDKLAEFK